MTCSPFTFDLLTNLKNYIMATSNTKKSTDSAKASDKQTDKKETASKGGSKPASDSKKESGSTKK